MKKSLLSAFAMIIASCGVSSANVQIASLNVEQPANDTLMFALPVDVNHYQDIQNYPDANPGARMMRFQPEYLVTATDFSKGDINKGTATLPANAKVIGLGLDGYDVASQNTSKGIFLEVTAWCRNVPNGSELNATDIFDGYGGYTDMGFQWYHYPQGELFTDTVTYRGYNVGAVNHPGYICTFDPEANEQDPRSIVDIPFGNPIDPNKPFWYKGESIYLELWMCNWFDVRMKYRYMTYDEAELECASLMRSGNYCFNSETYELIAETFGTQLMYELPTHRLPAFRTPYFTNDVRVSLTDQDADVKLQDADGNIIAPAEDGNFYSLDHTMVYHVIVDGTDCGEISFDDIYSDIDLTVNKDVTAVEEINNSKTVASVVYYNLAGEQSAQPVDGVNIIVTTYSDGTRSTAKVIK